PRTPWTEAFRRGARPHGGGATGALGKEATTHRLDHRRYAQDQKAPFQPRSARAHFACSQGPLGESQSCWQGAVGLAVETPRLVASGVSRITLFFETRARSDPAHAGCYRFGPESETGAPMECRGTLPSSCNNRCQTFSPRPTLGHEMFVCLH